MGGRATGKRTNKGRGRQRGGTYSNRRVTTDPWKPSGTHLYPVTTLQAAGNRSDDATGDHTTSTKSRPSARTEGIDASGALKNRTR